MTAGRIPLWLDLRDVPVNKRLPYLHVGAEAGCERILLERGDPHAERRGLTSVTVDGHMRLKSAGQAIGRLVRVVDAKSQAKAAQAGGVVVVEADDWRIIPLENLIAARRDRPATLYAIARTPEQAALFADTLQTGVHGIVLAPRSPQDIIAADAQLRSRWRPQAATPPGAATSVNGTTPPPSTTPAAAAPPTDAGDPTAARAANAHSPAGGLPASGFLEPATITAVADGGMGDRVCIDTTSLFRPGEGLLVGSTARSFCLVHAETHGSEYIQARPFRVNAGAVHMYLFAPDGKTHYLSELAAGTPVLAIHPDGVHRMLTIGRAKVERRPHTLVHWTTRDGKAASAMLQTAETIRLVQPDGASIAVTDLKAGASILVHNEEAARHTGLPVDAHLEER